MLGRPALMLVQVSPASSLLNTCPSPVPAKTTRALEGSTATALISRSVSPPPSSCFQFSPALIVLKSPDTLAAAYTVSAELGSVAIERTSELTRPLRLSFQLPPPSTLLKSPPVKDPA